MLSELRPGRRRRRATSASTDSSESSAAASSGGEAASSSRRANRPTGNDRPALLEAPVAGAAANGGPGMRNGWRSEQVASAPEPQAADPAVFGSYGLRSGAPSPLGPSATDPFGGGDRTLPPAIVAAPPIVAQGALPPPSTVQLPLRLSGFPEPQQLHYRTLSGFLVTAERMQLPEQQVLTEVPISLYSALHGNPLHVCRLLS